MRLIDADKLWKHKFKSASEKMDLDVVYMSGWNDAIDSIVENAPIVDAVPVVRCKDCMYGEPNGQYGCKCYHYKLYETHEMSPNDFCSRAERRNDGKIN